jgi:hypothetical protein
MATRIRREGTRGSVLRTSPIYGVLGNEKKQDHPVATDYGHPTRKHRGCFGLRLSW